MSFLTDRQLSVLTGTNGGFGVGGWKLNLQTPQYDSRFETSTKAASEGGIARKGGLATWLLQ